MTSRPAVDVSLLPSVPLSDKRYLPDESGVYFVMDGSGAVRYVGASVSLKKRWASHHKIRFFRNVEGAAIAYAKVDVALLRPVEQLMFHCFKPPLNEVRGCPSDVVFVDPPNQLTAPVMVDAALYEMFCEKAMGQEVTERELLETAIRDRLSRVGKKITRSGKEYFSVKRGGKVFFSQRVWSKERWMNQSPAQPAAIDAKLYRQLEKYADKVRRYVSAILEDILDEEVNGCG
jgi:hypothetical protein